LIALGMSYGLQISASGLFTAMYRQDVYANNLANADTPGFKPDIPSAMPRDVVRREDGVQYLPSNPLLERLGAGALLNRNAISFAQGSLRTTGNALDVAITGSGFLTVRDREDGKPVTRLTRDGRLSRNAAGTLVLASSGAAVLDERGNPISIPSGPSPTIDGDGTIRQNGAAIAQLRVIDVPEPQRLGKVGNSLFSVSEADLRKATPATGRLTQRAIEESGADEIKTIMDMTSASRSVDAQVALIQQHDRLMDRAINGLGRVA